MTLTDSEAIKTGIDDPILVWRPQSVGATDHAMFILFLL